MATFIQKIFLPKSKITALNQKQEVLDLVSSNPIAHHAYMTKKGAIVRRFSIKTNNCHMFAERTFDGTRPEEQEVQYFLRIDAPSQVIYATHSTVDKFAQQVYKKMYKIWEKNKKHAK